MLLKAKDMIKKLVNNLKRPVRDFDAIFPETLARSKTKDI